LSDERQAFQYRMQGLEHKNGKLYHGKGELWKQLEEKTRMAQVYSSKVSTLEYKVTELNVEKGKVEKQLEDTRKAGVLFMNAADEYQEVVEREIKTVVQELKDTKQCE
jgi:predicted  nucleic acid-binding Zn-ribbon protein